MTQPGTAPQWLLQSEVGLCPCGCIGTRRKGRFVEKTVNSTVNVVRHALFADDLAGRDGLLQRIEPRTKLISLLALLIVAALVRNIPVLLGLYAVTLVLAAGSNVPLGFFIKRVWLFIPIFTGLVVLPATLNVVTHGHIVVSFGHWWFGRRIGLTRQGLDAAGLIVTRVAVSISLVVLLTLTTSWNRLLAALRALRVPRLFILVVGMCYRYIFHLLGAVTDMYTARKARSAGQDNDIRSGRAFVAATAGALFGKAHALSEEVHQAMISRGYTGDVRTLRGRRIGAVDVVWLVGSAALALAVLGGDRALGH